MVAVLILTALAESSLPGANDYLAGRAAERGGKYGDAVAAYGVCITKEGPLAPYAGARSALCRSRAGDPEGAIGEYRRLVADHPEGPWVRMAQVQLAALLMEHGKHEEAARLFEHFLAVEPKLWWFDRYAWLAADNLLAREDTQAGGYAFFRQVVQTTAFRAPRLDGATRLARSPDPEDRLVAAMGMLRSGANGEACNVLLGVAPAVLSDSVELQRLTELGARALAAMGRNEGVERQAGTPSGASWVRLWLAYSVRQRLAAGDTPAAQAVCDQLVEQYPGSTEAGDALWWLARSLVRQDEPSPVITQYLRLAEHCPGHARAGDALLAAARLQRGMGRNGDALATFQTLAAGFADGPFYSEVCYGAGSLREAAGDVEGATEDYRRAAKQGLGDYYAHRALARLADLGAAPKTAGEDVRVADKEPFLKTILGFSAPMEPLLEDMFADPAYQRLAFFGSHGFDEGEWEALHLGLALAPKAETGTNERPDDSTIYQALCETGLAFTAQQFAEAYGWGMQSDRPSVHRLRVSYPRAYWPQVIEATNEAGLDPYLLLAVARQESQFRPALTSWAGAQGVMQVMPATAKWLVKEEPNIKAEHAANLEDPVNSLRLGAYYLARMMERSGDNIVFALASYNAGPGNVSAWLQRKEMPKDDLHAFIEAIPFGETREYVKGVLGNYAAYRSLYPPRAAD